MTEEKLIRLLQQLKIASEHDRLDWQETADEGSFRVHLGGGMVRVGEGVCRDDDDMPHPAYHVTILDRRGNVVDEMSETGGPLFDLIGEVHRLARRRARNAEQALDEMLSAIGGKTQDLPAR